MEESWDDDMIREALNKLLAEGMSGTEAAKQLAKLGRRPRKEVYRLWLSMEEE